jgi:hypothetical protein
MLRKDLELRRIYNKAWYRKHRAAEILRTKQWAINHPEMTIYKSMIKRCQNPNSNRYRFYGARGIKVLYKSCKEFIADVGPRPGKEFSIDRINNDGNYEPGNCRWATHAEQMRNTQRSKARLQ